MEPPVGDVLNLSALPNVLKEAPLLADASAKDDFAASYTKSAPSPRGNLNLSSLEGLPTENPRSKRIAGLLLS
jgi:hypothetical protein